MKGDQSVDRDEEYGGGRDMFEEKFGGRRARLSRGGVVDMFADRFGGTRARLSRGGLRRGSEG